MRKLLPALIAGTILGVAAISTAARLRRRVVRGIAGVHIAGIVAAFAGTDPSFTP
jgi:hypothetical protein